MESHDISIDKSYIRKAFDRGMCPCCCSPLFGWTGNDGEEHEPEPIAEGVEICGRCVGNKHCDDSPAGQSTLRYILETLASGI